MRRIPAVRTALPICVCVLVCSSGCPAPPEPLPTPDAVAAGFVNFESAHVSPLALSPGGTQLYAANTADNSIEIFELADGVPAGIGRVPVGLEPVSVRARTDGEVWVVNRVSDSVSVVDLASRSVVRTLRVGDEPGDVVFANGRAFVSCLAPSRVLVYELDNLDAPPMVLSIQAHDPRAMAVSADGLTVYAAVFESGNHTSLVEKPFVSEPDSPYGGQNPPPNSGAGFFPPMTEGLWWPFPASQLVRKDPLGGRWLDDNGGDWTHKIRWDLHDHDVAVIDADSLAVSYVSGLMNVNMQLAALPGGGLFVVGTEAANEVRFEPNLTGRFVRSIAALVGADASRTVLDLNPHLAEAYQQKLASVAPALRDLSIADPRGVAWRPDGSAGYVTGMGTNNVIMVDAGGGRLAEAHVGQGPTGIVYDRQRSQLYVLNRFEATISVLDAASLAERSRMSFFDPTPPEIRSGRPFLYDARLTSGLGVTACASCHIDARVDGLAWDLGNPAGQIKVFNQECDTFSGFVASPFCEDFHPMKGPMITQSLQGIIGAEPFHWRGDRENLAAFNPAFMSLMGADGPLTDDEMARFTAFIATVRYPPNPNRNLDDSLRDWVHNGSPQAGFGLFTTGNRDGGTLNCNGCHVGSLGSNRKITPGDSLDGISFKVPQLRGLYKKMGFSKNSQENDRGFGFVHDGLFSTLHEFLHFRAFSFDEGEAGQQQRRDLEAFLLSFPTDTHPGVGTQVTLTGSDPGEAVALVDLMLALADDGKTDLAVHARAGIGTRGYAYAGRGVFQSDMAAEQIDAGRLRAQAASGAEQTWTVVPLGSATRVAIDHNGNGIFDGEE